ncbi:polysaccharide export protein [Methylomarinum sp. Ch1-1]|uniref:Polysaccharide export protein n=1 Tax=Methylomarinum roseum TaxID=3067653 RepID=A0AAU7NQB5_9GAMM
MKNKILFVLLTLFILSGCTYPPLEDVKFPSDYTYIIGPGDSLEIFVWGNPDISRGVTVRPDGKITTPLVDDLIASGKTPYQLAREVEEALAKFVRDPQVAIIVGGFQGVYSQQVRVIGQISGGGSGGGAGAGGGGGGGGGGFSGGGGGLGANRYSATALPYSKGMSLLDLVIQLGGIGQYGDGNRASIIRRVDGEQRQFGVRIDDLLEDGDMSANVNIMPGDILIVPEAFF